MTSLSFPLLLQHLTEVTGQGVSSAAVCLIEMVKVSYPARPRVCGGVGVWRVRGEISGPHMAVI